MAFFGLVLCHLPSRLNRCEIVSQSFCPFRSSFSAGGASRSNTRVLLWARLRKVADGCRTLWVSRRRLFKPARMPKSGAPMDARVKWGRMLLDAREARKC